MSTAGWSSWQRWGRVAGAGSLGSGASSMLSLRTPNCLPPTLPTAHCLPTICLPPQKRRSRPAPTPPGPLAVQTALGLGLDEPGRHVNITLTNCTLTLKRSDLHLRNASLPAGLHYSLSLRGCSLTLNRVRLRGRLAAAGRLGLDFSATESVLTHNRLLVERGAKLGPFPELQPRLRLTQSYVADNLVGPWVAGMSRCSVHKCGAAGRAAGCKTRLD